MSQVRLFIETKEVARLLGKSTQVARKEMAKCREYYQKPKGSGLTYKQYADYLGVSVELVLEIIFGKAKN
jgi:hypothetical protein